VSDLVRVLLVDDQVRNLEALEAVLAATGCRLVRATSADEALLALLQHDFAAIVLDIRMPGMNGIDLAQIIRARRRTRHVPILFLTAHLLDEKDVLRGYLVGAVDYLTKPLNPEILRAKIAVFVDLYRKSQALAAANDALQREIAEREKADEALRHANQDLEQRVEARTAEVVHAHAVLRASEERLRLALDAGRMGTWSLDDSSGTTQIDDVECGLLGLEPGTRTLSGEAFFDLVHPDDRDPVRAAVDRARTHAVQGTGDFEVEFRVVRPGDGAVRWHVSRGRCYPSTGDPPGRTLGVSFDITERKRVEEALQDADRRKNDFLATLAHELRNPLAPIGNAVQVLVMRGGVHPETQWARNLIARQTKQLARLVDDLLDISRITQDKLELRREPVELARIVQSAVETSRPLIDDGGHDLTLSLPEEPIRLNADLTRVAQVLSNLLNNAARHSDPGGRISLRVERDGADAVIRVSDTGVGIPAPMLSRIFEMFVQDERSRERPGGGLGVGLALARRLVAMHDGTITAHSDGPGTGSEFVVRLPVHVEASTGTRTDEDNDHRLVRSRLRILVVDDNHDSVESLSMLLRMTGNDIRGAHDGLEAIEVAAGFRPDVVLLDIGLPRLNGYETARRLRAQDWGKQIVLIALTGWGQETDRRESFQAGFDHHLVKPVDPRRLMRLLANLNAVSVPLGVLETPVSGTPPTAA
jgi:PAS domain S-box-containing protein